MAGFASHQALKDAVANGQYLTQQWYKSGSSTSSVSNWVSLWRVATLPAAGADPAVGSGTPGAGGTAYSSTAGGITLGDLATKNKYLLDLTARSVTTNSQSTIWLMDRLVGVSGLTMNSTGDKNCNTVALPRYATGVGVMAFLEITTAGTTTTPVVSLSSYTNQSGTGGKVGGTISFPGTTTAANTLVGPLPLASGDTGIRSVETINVGTAGGGAGVVNLILVKPLWMVGSTNAVHSEVQFFQPNASPIRVYDGATLMFADTGQSSTQTYEGSVTVVWN
jgi:hypothetical protein